ncbi:SUN domain-containing protein 2-like [Protopterus annectens]|uniref:SUN domain-containing protein 2-like n=1 Tax=Protopterus annectens TaxID=7888 RepID=UPI001CFA2F5F|nr:SUN domain-containing protein 2-like [Protopterus annectens]
MMCYKGFIKELDVLRAEQQKVLEEAISKTSRRSQELQAELELAKSELKSKTKNEQDLFLKKLSSLEEQLSGMRNELKELQKAHWETEAKVDAFPAQMQSVQDDVHSHLPQLVHQILFSKGSGGDSGQPLASSFIRQEEMQAMLRDLEKKILADVSRTRMRSSQQASAAVGATFEGAGVMGVTEEQVNDIVERALQLYSEDRIGLVDYALESAGASVLNTRCSETYETGTALMSLFGIPLWYQSQSPRVIIQPDVHPGNCWAFRGTQGFVVIQLSAEVIPTAVTLEHISKAVSPMGSINTAPREFVVFGLQNETDHQGTPLGQFTYSEEGNPIQTFPVQNKHAESYRIIELRVLSNWGHPEYTCIYRFRVHGDPVNRT